MFPNKSRIECYVLSDDLTQTEAEYSLEFQLPKLTTSYHELLDKNAIEILKISYRNDKLDDGLDLSFRIYI